MSSLFPVVHSSKTKISRRIIELIWQSTRVGGPLVTGCRGRTGGEREGGVTPAAKRTSERSSERERERGRDPRLPRARAGKTVPSPDPEQSEAKQTLAKEAQTESERETLAKEIERDRECSHLGFEPEDCDTGTTFLHFLAPSSFFCSIAGRQHRHLRSPRAGGSDP